MEADMSFGGTNPPGETWSDKWMTKATKKAQKTIDLSELFAQSAVDETKKQISQMHGQTYSHKTGAFGVLDKARVKRRTLLGETK